MGCGRPGRRWNRLLIKQSHPAHVVAGAGIVWRTSAHKGSPLLHRRAPAPNTADRKGSPDGLRGRQAIGGPFAIGGRNADQQNARGAVRGEATFRSRLARVEGDGWAGRAHGAGRRCALGVPRGMRDTGCAANGGHGPRGTGSVRGSCGRCCSGVGDARRHAWMCRIRPAACHCSLGSGCTTRTGRSCRCAGAWGRRTADMPAPGEP